MGHKNSADNQECNPFIESNDNKNNNYCQFYNCHMFHHKEPLILLQTVKNTCEGVLFLINLHAATL